MAEQNTKSDLKYCLEIARGDDSLCGFLASGEKFFFLYLSLWGCNNAAKF